MPNRVVAGHPNGLLRGSSASLNPAGMGDLTQVYVLIVLVLGIGLAVAIDYQRRKNRRDS